MDTRREFLKKASLLTGATGLMQVLPPSIRKAMAIDPAPGSTFYDAEHIVFLMQENRSFDHTYGTLQGVRGFNDPRAIRLPNQNKVWLQSDETGATYCPFRLDMKGTKATWMSSLPHGWADQVDARNNGRYDKWLFAKHSDNKDYAAMPLTLGYYTREDIPFYYALADAFTVCDQHFCSSLTGTTPNRLHFWTGTIRERQDPKAIARVWNGDADFETMVNWPTFPERLEENGISWKVYQNELSVGVGFEEEEDAWLANFGDNPLEYFTQYRVKMAPAHIAYLPKAALQIKAEITRLEKLISDPLTPDEEKAKAKENLEKWQHALLQNEKDQQEFNQEKYRQLSPKEKNIHEKAFATNIGDPDYHRLETLSYEDGNESRKLRVPKGDILHQFRHDVQSGSLPTVSWIVAPQNFSDHPSSAWFGAWYISEVMDILTHNPEIWKKTIFVLTYDENDGYFDHVPPFVAPHPTKPDTGLTSKGISTDLEFVMPDQQSSRLYARESPIGLGYRVPLVIASPWSRGGWVCSEVFDHTSSLLFLETYLRKKTGKPIIEPNITPWRRTVCGDLSSAFRPWNAEKVNAPSPIERDPFIEEIHKAKFKREPSNYKKLSDEEISHINQNPASLPLMPGQEKGTRPAAALPYELYAESRLGNNRHQVEITLKAGNTVFGSKASGSPFNVYAPGVFRGEAVNTRAYAVTAGDQLSDTWKLDDFDKGQYQLQIYGPNGFFREFTGNAHDPDLEIASQYERLSSGSHRLSGNVRCTIINKSGSSKQIQVSDNAYKTGKRTISLGASGSKNASTSIIINTSKSFGWYDFSIRVKGFPVFEKRYAGRVETGASGRTDPAMGREI